MSGRPKPPARGERRAILAHRRLQGSPVTPDRWVYFLHGFLGSGRNWASIGRALVQERPDWGVVLVDLRLHGDSQDFHPPHTVEASADDVNSLIRGLRETEHAIVGHSFGGKVALAAARQADPTLSQVWVIDSTPAATRTRAGADRLMDLLTRLPGPFADRADLVSAVQAAGFEKHIAQWTATNLVRGPDGYRWRLDFAALNLLLADFYREDLWSVVDPSVAGREIIFVRATTGSILEDDAADRIRRLEADGECVRLIDLEGDHWLHVANPDALLELFVRYLPRPRDPS